MARKTRFGAGDEIRVGDIVRGGEMIDRRLIMYSEPGPRTSNLLAGTPLSPVSANVFGLVVESVRANNDGGFKLKILRSDGVVGWVWNNWVKRVKSVQSPHRTR